MRSASLLVALTAVANASEDRANPIRKVVTMLQMMQKKVEAEGEKEKEMFDKFMCYCKNGGEQLSGQVEGANTRIPQLGSDIEEAENRAATLKEELKTAQTERSAAKQAMADATAVREKEHAAYVKESTELKTNVAAVNKAVSAIESGMAGAFLQTESAQLIRKIAINSENIMDADRQDIIAFLSGGSAGGYVPMSGEITGILKQLGETMQKNLDSTTATEEDAKQTYEELMAAKKKEVEALTVAIETKMKRVGELGVEIVQMKNDLSDTEAQLIEDQKMLGDLEKDCKTKQDEWSTIIKQRQEELVALADTIKILNDDDALELFKKTLPGASFVQMQDEAATRQSALQALERAQNQESDPRPRIDFIMMAIRGKKIGFEKVIKMIDEMVGTLKQEQLDDDHKKEYCDQQFDIADDKKKGLETKISGLETAIMDAEEGITKLKQEIDDLEDSMKALDKQVAEMTEQRQAESSDYQELMASDAAAKELLEFAKNRLNKFYNPKLYKPPEEAAAFVQISLHSAQEPPPEAPGPYKKKGEESGGVIAMIDVLIKDLDREMTEAEVTEKNAQEDYERFMSDSAESRQQSSKSLTEKMATKANLQADLESNNDEKDNSAKELMATETYIGQLHGECDWLLKYFDMRKDARTNELESLQNAKAVLSGANFALIQTNTNVLRKSRANGIEEIRGQVMQSEVFQSKVQQSCSKAPADQQTACEGAATEALFCQLLQRSKPDQLAAANCTKPSMFFMQLSMRRAPEDDLAQEMTHDLEMNFNKIAPFGKEDTAKELQDHAAKTQDTLVDAVENAEVAEIKRAVFRALTRLRAATIKEFDTIARLETQAIDAYNDAHHYRAENPLTHLHEDEAPVETDKLKSFH
jgi:chromosome segregation ATPase